MKPSNRHHQRLKFRQSLAFRYLGIAIACLITIQLLFGAVQIRREKIWYANQLGQQAQIQAQVLGNVADYAVLQIDRLTLDRLLRETIIEGNLVYGVIASRGGATLAAYINSEHPSIHQTIQSSNPAANLDAIRQLQDIASIKEVQAPIYSRQQIIGSVMLGYSNAVTKADGQPQAVVTLVMAIGASLMLALLIITLFNQQVRSPLQELAELATALAAGELDHQPDPASHAASRSEIGQVKSAFHSIAAQLQHTLTGLQLQIGEQERSKQRLNQLNQCFLQFGSNPNENIDHLVAICGELMQATSTFYSCLQDNQLHTLSRWQTPPNFPLLDNAKGNICHTVIQQNDDHPLILRHLPRTAYADTDPNIRRHQLQTYVGIAVRWNRMAIGALCAVYKTDVQPSAEDQQIMSIIASAISVEEERRRVENKLRDREKHYRTVLQSVKEVIFQTDLSGRWTFLNQAWTDMTGFAVKESLGKSFQDYVHPNDRQRNLDQFLSLVAHHQTDCRYEVRYLTQDQGTRWIEVFAHPNFDHEGKFIGILGTLQDITDRQQAEIALQESEARVRLFVEHTPAAIAMFDRQMRYMFTSRRWLADYGITNQDVIGRSHYEVFPEIPERWKVIHAACMAGEVRQCEEDMFPRDDGSVDWVRWEIHPWHNDTGNVGGIIMFTEVVTERRLAQQELQDSEASIRSLYQVTSARALSFEERLSQMLTMGSQRFGLEIGMLSHVEGDRFTVKAAQTPDDSIHAGDVFQLSNTYCCETLKADEPLCFEQARDTTWSSHPCYAAFKLESYLGTAVLVAGKPYGTLAFSSLEPYPRQFKAVDRELLKLMAQWIGGEIERQQAAADLSQARDDALAATRAKSNFLAMMSHEIRTPMNGVIGMTGLLLDTALTSQQQSFVETIRNSGDTLLAIINDILDFSKIESGKLDLEKQPFDLRECIESALDLLATRAADKQLELAYRLDPQVPAQIVGDMTRLQQILVNLLSNAVKFTSVGEVIVSVSLHQPDANEIGVATPERSPDIPTVWLEFAVQDTGIGIPSDRLDRLFKSFSQIDSSISRQYGGTGLGLAICERLCTMMGGQIWVKSSVGEGSTFYFTIESQIEPAPSTLAHPSLSGLRQRRLLIVDDSATQREILAEYAQQLGMTVYDAASGMTALQVIGQQPAFDIALIDLHMPGMEGLKLAAALRQLPTTQALPLVMLTSVNHSLATDDPVAATISAWQSKPIKLSQLSDVLLRTLQRQTVDLGPSPSPRPNLTPNFAAQIPLRILLAEDNIVNQQLAVHLLHRMGYRPDVVSNGLEVLEALHRQPYDVVLMDVQMPEMDGLTATRQIQQQWPEGDRPRIIAMTANAMRGDREECLAAGMDDYVSKPIRIANLLRALQNCAPDAALQLASASTGANQAPLNPHADSPTPTESNPSLPVEPSSHNHHQAIDSAALNTSLAMMGGVSAEALAQLLDIYRSNAAALIEMLDQAVAQQDIKAMVYATHTLKSTSATMGATYLAQYCADLETMGRKGEVQFASIDPTQISREYDQVIADLEAIARLLSASGPIP